MLRSATTPTASPQAGTDPRQEREEPAEVRPNGGGRDTSCGLCLVPSGAARGGERVTDADTWTRNCLTRRPPCHAERTTPPGSLRGCESRSSRAATARCSCLLY